MESFVKVLVCGIPDSPQLSLQSSLSLTGSLHLRHYVPVPSVNQMPSRRSTLAETQCAQCLTKQRDLQCHERYSTGSAVYRGSPQLGITSTRGSGSQKAGDRDLDPRARSGFLFSNSVNFSEPRDFPPIFRVATSNPSSCHSHCTNPLRSSTSGKSSIRGCARLRGSCLDIS